MNTSQHLETPTLQSDRGVPGPVRSLLEAPLVGRTVSSMMVVDHSVLRTELSHCLSTEDISLAAFDRFRHHLLWHVAVEERLLMPALVDALGRVPEYVTGLRKDHTGLVALCVPRPQREWVENLRDLLDEHFRIEESPQGLYDLFEQVVPSAVQKQLTEAIDAFPPLKLGPFAEGPAVRPQLRDILRLVGASAPEPLPSAPRPKHRR